MKKNKTGKNTAETVKPIIVYRPSSDEKADLLLNAPVRTVKIRLVNRDVE